MSRVRVDNSMWLLHRRLRRTRGGFGTIEPFIMSPIFLIFGVAISFTIRWLLTTTHWLTWLPTIVFSIPFMLFFGFLPVMALAAQIRDRRKSGL